jgi:DNA polymerase III epsilon subunit-like protein
VSGWVPTDGEVLTGRIVALDFATSSQDGQLYPLVVVQKADGDEVTVHGHHRVLKEELAKRAPRIGDELTITYLGEVTPDKGGRAYKAYRVEGGSNPFTWNLFRDPDDQLPAEHATGRPAEPTPSAAPTPAAPPAGPAPAAADPDDRIDPADEVAIRRLLEAITVHSKVMGARLTHQLNSNAGGPWAETLTAERGAKALAWLAKADQPAPARRRDPRDGGQVMTPVAAIDTETTGLDPDRHHVWEFAAVLADHDPASHLLVVTDRIHLDIPADLDTADPMALHIGGYYRRRTGNALPGVARLDPATAAGRIAHALAGRHVIGANPAFDIGFLDRLLRRHGHVATHNHHLIDVSPLVAGYLQGVGAAQHGAGVTKARHDDLVDVGVPPYRSTDLAEAVGVTVDPATRHTAAGDAWWALEQYAAVYGLTITREGALPEGQVA